MLSLVKNHNLVKLFRTVFYDDESDKFYVPQVALSRALGYKNKTVFKQLVGRYEKDLKDNIINIPKDQIDCLLEEMNELDSFYNDSSSASIGKWNRGSLLSAKLIDEDGVLFLCSRSGSPKSQYVAKEFASIVKTIRMAQEGIILCQEAEPKLDNIDELKTIVSCIKTLAELAGDEKTRETIVLELIKRYFGIQPLPQNKSDVKI